MCRQERGGWIGGIGGNVPDDGDGDSGSGGTASAMGGRGGTAGTTTGGAGGSPVGGGGAMAGAGGLGAGGMGGTGTGGAAGRPSDGSAGAGGRAGADGGTAGTGGQPAPAVWSGPASLVDDHGRLAIGSQVHIVGHLKGQLVHLRSADNGKTWEPPDVIGSAAGNFPAMYGGLHAEGDTLYLITADQDMDSSASAGGRQIRFRRSDDNGKTWTAPVTVNSPSSPMYRGRVGAFGSYVHFVGTATPTSGASLWYFRSKDRGATWTATQLAKDLGTYGGGQTVAVDGAFVHVGYTDANGSVGAGPTLYIRSTDNGETWSKPVVIGENTASSSRQARVQLSATDGRVFACWQREPSVSGGKLPADRLGYNTSSDKGVTWGVARVLAEDSGVERNHQHIWMAPGGGVHIVWRHGDSGDNVADPAGYKYSPDYGAKWLPRVIAIDTTKTVGANHPWAIVANGAAIHILTGPSGKMQYVRKPF